jgi:hypothetical protein
MLTCLVHGTAMVHGTCPTCEDVNRVVRRGLSHYCPWDAPGRRVVQAHCGIYIRRTEHDNDPTCPECRRVLAYVNSTGPS